MSKKQFVKYTHFEDNRHTPRNSNKGPRKSKYLEKPVPKLDGAIAPMIKAFSVVENSPKIEQLLKQFPKFFNKVSRRPDKDQFQSLNEFVTINVRKPPAQIHRHEPMVESDDPDWECQSNEDFDLESRVINEDVKQQAEKKFADLPVKKVNDLRPYERQLIEEYIRSKAREEQQSQSSRLPNKEGEVKQEIPTKKNEKEKQPINKSEVEKKPNVLEEWLDHKSDSGFWVQKIDNDDDFNDFSQGEEEVPFDMGDQGQKEKQTSSDEDDAFVDEKPTVIHAKAATSSSSEKSKTNDSAHGTVLINKYCFSKVAEQIGLPPGGCVWVISNKEERYKVSTEYMDQIYNEHRIYQHYPYISLNHSEFVHHADALTEKGFEKLKRFNERKVRAQNKYKQGEDKRQSRPSNPNITKKQYQPNPHKKR